jgi:cell division protein FtsW
MAYKANGDRMLFLTTSLLTLFGLLMVYSDSSVVADSQHGLSSYYFLRQSGYAIAGYVLLLLLMNVDYHVWQRKKVILALAITVGLGLIAVFVQPKINGAHRWLRQGSISFQPSETAKLVVLAFLASYLHQHAAEINRPAKRLLPCLSLVALFAGLVGFEPDLGQALCLIMIVAVLLFAAGLSWKYILGVALCAIPVFYLAVVRVHFRWERIKSFLDPFQDPLGSGWQISQSLTAVATGGFFGLGLGASKQKLFFLPEAHSDFIFAVIGEELGLVGTTLVTFAFLIFLYRGVRITLRAPDRFGFYLGLGITLMVVVQAFINISMVLAMMPTKGIALPFISQGGSSLLMNLGACGILLNISCYGEQSA